MTQDDKPDLTDRLASAAFVSIMTLARLLPYHLRIPTIGWIFAHLLAPVAGWRGRIRENLALACPELTTAEVEALVRKVPDNTGRSIAEIYAGEAFTARMRQADSLEGPGLRMLETAFERQRPVIIAVAHFGNYDAMRATLTGRGWPVGALYRPMNNEAFNRHYIPAIKEIAEPLFPRSRSGMAGMLRFLKGGGALALGYDQYDRQSPELRFFDLPTRTVLTPAELAVRYDALLMPIHSIRQPDGLSFRIVVGLPITPDEPARMMQALNDRLEDVVRQNMDQWFWIHRRWKAR